MHVRRCTGRPAARGPTRGAVALLLAVCTAYGGVGCRTERSFEELTGQVATGDGSGDAGDDPASEAGWQRLVRRFADALTPVTVERWLLASGPTLDFRFVPPTDGEIPRCMTWLAASWAPGTDTQAASSVPDGPDIDLVLYDPDGNVVAADLGTDNFPVVARWCPVSAGTHTARVRLSPDATARVQLGGFVHPPATDPREAATVSLLASVAARLPAANREGPVQHVSLQALTDHALVVPIVPGTCMAVAAWAYAPIGTVSAGTHETRGGSGALGDSGHLAYDPSAPIVDLVVQEEGDPPRADIGETNAPLLPTLCAPRNGAGQRLRVLLRARHQAADVAWATFVVPAP